MGERVVWAWEVRRSRQELTHGSVVIGEQFLDKRAQSCVIPALVIQDSTALISRQVSEFLKNPPGAL